VKARTTAMLALVLALAACDGCASRGDVPVEGVFRSSMERVIGRTEVWVAADEALSDEDRAVAEAELVAASAAIEVDSLPVEDAEAALIPVLDRHDAYAELLEDELERDVALFTSRRIRSLIQTVRDGAEDEDGAEDAPE
jgi:hypothetical protein